MMVDDVSGVNYGMTVVAAACKVIHRPLCRPANEPPVPLKVWIQMVNHAIRSKQTGPSA
jgi:hypothetical protein